MNNICLLGLISLFCWVNLHSSSFASESMASTLQGYDLVWADDFVGSTIDASKWMYRDAGKWRRDAKVEPNQVTLDGKGNLVIEVNKVEARILTGMVATQGLFAQRYGYFEARVKLPFGFGFRPAFWLQSPTIGKVIGDPERSGVEIDIFEFWRKPQDHLQHAIHWDGYRKHHKSVKLPIPPGNMDVWRTFGFLWTCKRYTFFVDGERTAELTYPISKASQYLILSIEVPSEEDLLVEYLPASFLVDYVKVFQSKDRDRVECEE